MEPAPASGVRGEGGSQSTEAYSPRTKRLREVLLGGTSAKRPSPSAECVFNPSSAEELQDVQSTSTDEERLSPVEGGDVNYSPDELAHYQSWMDASWRALEGRHLEGQMPPPPPSAKTRACKQQLHERTGARRRTIWMRARASGRVSGAALGRAATMCTQVRSGLQGRG